MSKYLYHVTSRNAAKAILRYGLKCGEDGHIYLFDHTQVRISNHYKYIRVVDQIMCNQIDLDSGVILRVDTQGITSDILPDNVAEFTARWQYRVKQTLIEHEYIIRVGYVKCKYVSPYALVL